MVCLEFKYRYLIFIAVFFIAIVYVQGEASAAFYSTSYSANGKIVKVNKVNVKPDYNGGYSVSNIYAPSGDIIGTITTSKRWGTDTKGRKYSYSYVDNVLSSSKFNLASGSFSWKSSIQRSNDYKSIEKISGKLNSKTSFSGNSIYTLNNGKLIKRVTKLSFKQSGKKVATSTITTTPTYTSYGYYSKITDIMQTHFTNGDTRYSKIIRVYTRDYYGNIASIKITGISSGHEKIGKKRVSYTGKIFIGSTWIQGDGWIFGNYKETKKSSSKKLLKKIPYESLLFDEMIQRRGDGGYWEL